MTKPSYDELLSALGSIVGYAESRAEDLSEIAKETREENPVMRAVAYAEESANKAWERVEAARALLARVEASAITPHAGCKTPSDCRREQICLDAWHCSANMVKE